MQYSEFKSALDVADTHLSHAARHMNSDGDTINIFVKEAGWPARIGRAAEQALNDAGWKFYGDIDSWSLYLY